MVQPASRKAALRLAILNSLLIGFCLLTFWGTLSAAVQWNMPFFPLPLLFLLYVVVFSVAWARFGLRLPGNVRGETRCVALLGAVPLFGLSLLGYAVAVWTFLFGDFAAGQMLNARIWVFGMLATLVLLAGAACVIVVSRAARNAQ